MHEWMIGEFTDKGHQNAKKKSKGEEGTGVSRTVILNLSCTLGKLREAFKTLSAQAVSQNS